MSVQAKLEDDEISLKETFIRARKFFLYLRLKWFVVVILALIGGAAGGGYAFISKPIFKASSTFVLEEEGTGGAFGQYVGIASMVGIDVGSGGRGLFQGDNIIELYKSRKMIEKALLSEVQIQGRKQLLIERYIDFKQLRQTWQGKEELKNLNFKKNKTGAFTRRQDSVMSLVVRDINRNYLDVVKPDKKLSIIAVRVEAEDEFFAKLFNDNIVETVNDFYIKTKTKKSHQNVAILQQKTDSVRAVMNGAVYTAVAASDATPNLNPTRQVQRAVPMQRAQISVETNKAILSELVKNLEMSKMALLQKTPLIQLIDTPIYPLEKSSVSRSKALILGACLGGLIGILSLVLAKLFSKLSRMVIDEESIATSGRERI